MGGHDDICFQGRNVPPARFMDGIDDNARNLGLSKVYRSVPRAVESTIQPDKRLSGS